MALGVILALVGFAVCLYYYLMMNYDYWKSLGVKGPKPTFFFGTVKEVMCGKLYMGNYIRNIYEEWKNEPFVGIYVLQTPYLVINDLDFIKDVLIRDFDKFADRGYKMYEEFEPLDAHLFTLESTRWKPLRTKLSPVFSAGKIKEMFKMLVECGDHLDRHLVKIIGDSKNGVILECRDLAAKFTTDVIGICAFGLKANAIASEDSYFRRIGKSIFHHDFKNFMKYRLRLFVPTLYSAIGPLFVSSEMHDFFMKTMRDTIDYRKQNNIVKHDFIDALMMMRDNPDKMPEIELTDEFLAAQLFVFFAGGFETSATTMSNALYELALNPEIQDKLRDEINKEMKKTGGKIQYDELNNMKYLDMVIKETLRLHPPVAYLRRRATSDYTFNISSENRVLKLKKDQLILIPNYGIQMDPQYYPDPDVFNPERFTDEAVNSRNPFTHLPFGNGPRNCIGKRFAALQTKVGLIKMLQNYRVDPCEKTQIPYITDPRTLVMGPRDGITLRISKIQKMVSEF